jgi:hypothetical protein
MRVFCRVKPLGQESDETTVNFPQKIIGETTKTKVQHQTLELNTT